MKKVLFLVIISMAFVFNVNAQSTGINGVVKVSAIDFFKKADSGNYPIIDIRTPREFAEGHIKGAINIDFYRKEFLLKMSKYKDKPFIFYCRSGNRTGKARKQFNSIGYKEGYELGSGIISWKRAGLKLVK